MFLHFTVTLFCVDLLEDNALTCAANVMTFCPYFRTNVDHRGHVCNPDISRARSETLGIFFASVPFPRPPAAHFGGNLSSVMHTFAV